MKLKKLFTLATVAVVSLGLLAGCGKSDEKAEASKESDDKVITVGATANPHAEILNSVVKPLLEKEGYTLNVKVFNDYVLPNKALADKSLDANFFQHVPYLEEFNKKNNTDLTYTVKVHIEPMAAFSDKVKKFEDLKDGAVIAVPNDPTNESRALKLLAKANLFEVADKELLTKADITKNPKNFEIKEIVAEQLPQAIKDVDIDVINSNYALQAKLNPVKDSLIIEGKDSPYANVLAVRSDSKDSEKIKALSKALNSKEVKEFIEKTYDGAVVPAF